MSCRAKRRCDCRIVWNCGMCLVERVLLVGNWRGERSGLQSGSRRISEHCRAWYERCYSRVKLRTICFPTVDDIRNSPTADLRLDKLGVKGLL